MHWKSFEVLNSTHYMADSFVLELPLYQQLNGWTVDKLSSVPSIEVSIAITLDNVSFTEIFLGLVDDVHPVELRNDTVVLKGRDYSSLLIDEPDTNKYVDFTSSDIAIQFAKDVGLTPVVAETSTAVGVYFSDSHVSLTSKQSKWDLLTYLANQEQFVVFVKSKELHFQPKVDLAAKPYILKWVYPTDTENFHVSNIIDLRLWRCLTLARNIQVTIRSWNYNEGVQHVATVTRSHKSDTYSDQKVQKYIYNIPNLSKQGVYDYALCQLETLTQHELGFSASLIGDAVLNVDVPIKLEGTLSQFDAVFYVYSITRKMSFGGSFLMDVEAKNHPTDSQVIA